MDINIFKLISGETIIAELLRVEEINARTGRKAFIVKEPRVVPAGFWNSDMELTEWLPICNFEHEEFPIPHDAVIIGFEMNKIDPVLLETYAPNLDWDD